MLGTGKMKKALLSKPGEWTDSVGDKLGRFLPSRKNKDTLPRKNSAPNLVNYGAEDDVDVPIGSQWDALDNDGCSRGVPDPQGPDTSSLSAFLMNLLTSDKNDNGGGNKSLGFGRGRAGAENQSPLQSRFHREPSGAAEEEGTAQNGEFYDVDWLLVDEHVKVSDPVGIPPRNSKKKLPSNTPDRLPGMSDQSRLLSDDTRCSIHPALPTLARGRRWVLLYSTEKHGMSLLTLYRNSNMMTGPLLLVAGDKEGAVFGGLITAPLVPSPKKKYQGTNDSFVFTNVSGTATIFHASGLNRYYVLAMSDSLALGGGSHFALHIDSELLHGSSGECDTFGSSCLANSEEFVLKHVELWGFDHTQRHGSLTEPSPLMSWS